MSEIGAERPEGLIQQSTYLGSDPRLVGKKAYISRIQGGWAVQFNDTLTGYGYGWWKFPYEDFRGTR